MQRILGSWKRVVVRIRPSRGSVRPSRVVRDITRPTTVTSEDTTEREYSWSV